MIILEMQKCIVAAVICSLCTNGNVYANKLEISSKNNTWKYLKESCKAANAAVSCSAIDCNTDFVLLYDVSNLPSTFIAWINTYLVKSASIVYQGCFSVPSTFFETQIQRYTNRNPLNCVRDCFSSSTTGLRYYSHIGINGTWCYCLLNPLSAHYGTVDISAIRNEGNCLDGININMKVYEIFTHRTLDKDYCPVAYPIDNVYIDIEECENHHIFLCAGKTPDINATSWYEAQKYCNDDMSTTLADKNQIHNGNNRQFWINGLQYREYEINKPLPLFDTRCAAVVRYNSKFSVQAVNCSQYLPTLCRKESVKEASEKAPSSTIPVTTDIVNKVSDMSTFQSTTINKHTDRIDSTSVTIYNVTEMTFSVNCVTMETMTPVTERIIIIVLSMAAAILVGVLVLVIINYKRKSSRNDQRNQRHNDTPPGEVEPLQEENEMKDL